MQGTQSFTQVQALLMEVKPYVLLDLFLMIWVVQELIYHEIREAKPYKLAYGMIVDVYVFLWTKTLRFI